ncbi:YdcF family protein [uncultured Hymenobacter sp.]|uniref:YdcF family protein n=1 Tax=uncultured Hymenobacter sp. TaxID=170016 RepID=UPI0035CBB50D
MFFLLSKLLQYGLSPAVWLVGLLLAALLARTPGGRRRWLRAGALLTLIGTNGALANEALRVWELPPVPIAQVVPHDAAVLLTGITVPNRSPHDRVYLGSGADRLTHALWLYRAGKVRRIIVAGGSGSVLGATQTEARDLATLLRLAGVPASAILLEERSRNTRENALFTRQLLAAHPTIHSLVLVTSAFHQRRALGCFRRAGLAVTPFPAGYYTTDRSPTPDYWLVPSADALAQWSRLLHEVAGYLTYRTVGYA